MSVFFFNDTATTEIYTLSLHDALPISAPRSPHAAHSGPIRTRRALRQTSARQDAHRCRRASGPRSEEHTSELQSRQYLVCRLLLEKNKHFSTYLSAANKPL